MKTKKPQFWKLTIANVAFQGDFFSKVDRSAGESGCWLWIGATNDRYGVFVKNGGREFAHRFSWVISNKTDIPPKTCVCHTCDNPLCVNPAHLWIGSHKQNTADAIKKGRTSPPPHYYGKQHHNGRRSACVNGHEFTQENTLKRSDAPRARLCRQCQIDRVSRRRQQRHLAKAVGQ